MFLNPLLSNWPCVGRAAATEAALAGKELSSGTLAAALLAVVDDVAPARRPEYASMAQGLLLQALAPAVKQHYAGAGGCPAHLERLLEVGQPGLESQGAAGAWLGASATRPAAADSQPLPGAVAAFWGPA